jgi:adenosylcobyric acid synthase
MGDLRWMRESGLENAVKKVSERCPVFGICGGYQMLGQKISDPENAEDGGEIKGMGLLGTETVLKKEKIRKQVSGLLSFPAGVFEDMKDIRYTGYEIHMGVTTPEGLPVNSDGKNVYGSYIHVLFDEGDIAMRIVEKLAAKKGVEINTDDELSYASLKEKNYDMLADMIRENMDMDKVYAALSPAAI